MGTEIERKFLLLNDSWRAEINASSKIVQAYLANTGLSSIRIRLQDEKVNLNIKSMTIGISRTEYEYSLPLGDAKEMIRSLCLRPVIEKTRYYIKQDLHTWEIDEFKGENQGLQIAEIELSHIDEELIKGIKKMNVKISVYTVNERHIYKLCKKLGINYIVTDYPKSFLPKFSFKKLNFKK